MLCPRCGIELVEKEGKPACKKCGLTVSVVAPASTIEKVVECDVASDPAPEGALEKEIADDGEGFPE